MNQNEEFDFDRPFTQEPRLEEDLAIDDPHADEISIDEGSQIISDISNCVGFEMRNAETMSGDDLARARRQTEIELAHVVEDLEARLIFLVNKIPERAWPGKNEEARSIAKAAARASDRVCMDLDRRRRVLEAELAAVKGEIEAREALDTQRRMAQKDLELDLTRQDLALRSRFAELDVQLRAADLIASNRLVPVAQLEREREERTKLVAQYLK